MCDGDGVLETPGIYSLGFAVFVPSDAALQNKKIWWRGAEEDGGNTMSLVQKAKTDLFLCFALILQVMAEIFLRILNLDGILSKMCLH